MFDFFAAVHELAHEKRWDDLSKLFQLTEAILAIPMLDSQVQAAAARLANAEANLSKTPE